MYFFKFYHIIYRCTHRIIFPKQKKIDNYLRTNKNKRNIGYKYFIEKKIIFFHIPKTAGKAVVKYVLSNNSCGHKNVKENMRIFKIVEFWDSFKFTVMRDPIKRFISAYNFVKFSNNYDYQNKEIKNSREVILQFDDINDFALNFITNKTANKLIHFKPQHKFISLFGRILVDKIFYQDKMEEMELYFDRKFEQDTNVTKKKDNIELTLKAKNHLAYIYRKDYKLIKKFQLE